MNFNSPLFISCRRTYLDKYLNQIKGTLIGRVLDVGGRRVARRGTFLPDEELAETWVILNPDVHSDPDIVGGLPNLPFFDSEFDNILCTEVLEYIDSPEVAIREMARVLSSHGNLYLSVPFLHMLHGDSNSDFIRFTHSYLQKIMLNNFHEVKIYAMGGMLSVIYDLIWYHLRKYRLLRHIFRPIGLCIVKNEKSSNAVTTGFFVEAKFPKN
jgi:SAM-dependent methyltransferase